MTYPRRVPAGLLALALVISMIIGPAYAARPTSTTGGTLAGKATVAGTRTAVTGASVTAVGTAGTFGATTGSNGTYSISGLPAGPYTVTCVATGFQARQLTATVRDGSKTTLNFALTPAVTTTGSLTGMVRGPDGVGIPGALVRTLTGGYSAQTGPDGSYRIDEMPAGTYDVLAAATGYADLTQRVAIVVGTTTSLDFSLAVSTLEITSLEASPGAFTEGMESTVTLSAIFSGSASGYTWSQVSGPRAPISDMSANSAVVDVSAIEVAAETSLVFSLTLTDSAGVSVSGTVAIDVAPADITPILGPNVQIGGSTYAATHAAIGGVEWAFFNVGAAFKATPVGTTAGAVHTLNLAGIVYDIDIIEWEGYTYALVACGNAGVAVVDVSDPAMPTLVSMTPVNYYRDGIIFCDTGGTIWYDNIIQSGSAPICALETDGTDLYIADNDFGFHKTALANLFGATGPVLEADGTLLVESEKYTLQWAGEKAWGGPISLKLRGDRLFVGMGALGMGIFDTVSLEQVGRYNLFTDVAFIEDYSGALDLSLAVHSDDVTGDLYLDDFTGMPDYRQVQFEVYEINKGNLTGVPTPWADFEREGQWYYGAADVDVAQYGERTIAFIAYSLGGIVAVDVTGCESASAASFMTAPYLGYFPAVPVNGPYDTGSNPSSLLPYEGAGMLKESGVTAIRVSGEKVLATDHFAGLMVLDGASAPETWQGSAPPYDNDTNGIPDDGVPDFEDITTYDMSPYDPLDNESLPVAFYEWPCQLATRELMGHGYGLSLFEPLALEAAGNVDVLECSSAGGFVFVDVKSLTAPLMEDRFEILGYFPTTAEIGADVNGAPTQTMAIGHASGISASNDYLYLSDGPHGISAWNITDALGFMSDDIHVVGNTVQDEYPQQAADGTWVYPPSHTVRNVIDMARGVTWAMCVGNGMRRTPIADIEAGLGTAGAPKLMALGRSDLFEHNSDEFSLKVFPYQDSAYDVEFRGDYAYVADGARGVTVYDVSKDPAIKNSGFFVANVGWNKGMPQLGTCSGIELWQDPATSHIYAVLACGPYGVGVVDVTDPMAMRIVKVFEPIKIEDGDIAVADGQAIDVEVIGDKAYYAYDSFGVLCFAMSDLIAPLPDGVSPTDLFLKNTLGTVIYDYRPWHLGVFKLQLVPGYEDVDGGAVRMEYTEQAGKLNIYAAFGAAGLVKIDFTDPAAPVLVQRIDTNVECVDVAISGGRIYCADGPGGMVFFK